VLAGQRNPEIPRRTLTTPLIDDSQHPEGAPSDQLCLDEIQPPALPAAGRNRGRAVVEGHALPALEPQTNQEHVEAVERADALVVDPSPLACD
jgi:hypothetical protein